MRYALLVMTVATLACSAPAAPPAEDTFDPAQIIGLEQAALERWSKGDPDGYFDIIAEHITYFDPNTAKRIDGLEALKKMIEPFRGKFRIDRIEMVAPSVQRTGDIAMLTTNLVSHGAQMEGGPKRDVAWNTTEIYQRIDGRWRIVHSHFSYTTPKLAQP